MTRKDKTTRKYILLTAYLLLTAGKSFGQLHHRQLHQNKPLVLATELLEQGQYANAAAAAKTFLQQNRDITQQRTYPERDKANYILAVSQLNTGAPDAETHAANYIHSTANPVYKQRAAFALANHYFRANAYNQAIEYYELAGISNLDNDELIYAKFELAYCYFNNSRFDEAEPLLAAVRELEGKYYDAGNYYYGLLAYNKSNYAEALTSFERIKRNPLYSNIVPYYIAEIHYFTNNKEQALSDAVQLINAKEKSYYHNELHLLAAQVHFENNRFKEALPYFEYYYDNTERIRKEDLYEMAYSYYQLNDWTNATENFKLLGETRDSLAQSSLYLLGDCYLKMGDKAGARNAFSLCADMPFNPGQKEASLLLAGKLSYETGYNNDAVYYINLLLADYPNSAYNDEAKTILSDLLIRTRNYAEAYDALQDVTKHNNNYKRIYQKVTYSYGMQQILNGNLPFADSLLSMSLAEGTDPAYKAAATFWKADLAYRSGNYNNVIKYGTAFAGSAISRDMVTHISPEATDKNMYTTLGYAAMELSKFAEAENYFAKARNAQGGNDTSFALATLLREADAVFMQKQYNKAIGLYDRVIAANNADADYARYQKAIILGLTNKNKEKAEILTGIANSTSRYANDARYELGLTYIEEDKYATAINVLTPLTQAFEVRNMAPRAWMKIGFAHQQSGQTEKAIASYKTIVKEYPSSEERPAAQDALKSLYIQAGTPELYALLLKEGNMGDAEDNMLDSAYYATAETQYGAGNWAKAKTLFANYLNKYPNGVFVNKARYYQAESQYQLGEQKEALAGYEAVLNANWSDFSENSARKAATIAYQQKDMAKAHQYYLQLRNMAMEKENLQTAYNGLMMTSHALHHYNDASAYADTLLTMPGTNETVTAHAQLIKAQALLKSGRIDEAMPAYRQIEKASDAAIAAEARYNIAYIHYMQGQYKEAEAAANNTVKLSGGQDYWIVKSYILISDVLVQQKDYFNAKALLQSIVKNCKIAELKTEATNKLKEVKQLETKKTKVTN